MQPHRLWISSVALGVRPRACRISQVPRSLSRYALPPTTPENRMTALACVFIIRAGFTLSGRLATLIVAFRGRIGFTFVAARTVRLVGLQPLGCPRHCPLGYMSHRHFTW